MGARLSHFTSNPSADGERWYVWDMYRPLPPAPVFIGSMEECGGVADALNARPVVPVAQEQP
jgi:hypothetical protein